MDEFNILRLAYSGCFGLQGLEVFQQDLLKTEVVQALATCDLLFGCVDSADGRDLR